MIEIVDGIGWRGTVRELADHLNCDYRTAQALVEVLRKFGAARRSGKAHPRGYIWLLPDSLTIRIAS